MKESKIVTVIIIILIIAIVGVLGFFIYTILMDTTQTESKQLENYAEVNQGDNIVKNETVQDPIANEQVQNQTIIDPIIPNDENEQTGEDFFTSTYYYSQLDETAKIIYNGLKDNKSKMISGNYIIDYGTEFNTLLNSDGGEEKLNEAFQSAWNAFSYDNIELFYIDATKITLMNEYHSLGGIKTYKISIGPGDNANYYYKEFQSQADVENAQRYLESIKEQITNQLSTDDIKTKIEKVHNWLIYTINYEDNADSKMQHTIYGALRNKKAVCEGYARSFKYLMDAVGVPCVLVSGTGTNSQGQTETHAWNYVQINQQWYAVDVTWDDPIIQGAGEQTSEMRMQHFLKGSDEFFKDHKEDGNISENSMNFKFPQLSKENYM